jgi:hypothetical protein
MLGLIERTRVEGLLCDTTVTTIDDLLYQAMPRPAARPIQRKLLDLFAIAPVSRAVLEAAYAGAGAG